MTRTLKYGLQTFALGALMLSSGCSLHPADSGINHQYQSRGQDSRVQYIVVHYTGLDLKGSLTALTERDVSSHYLIAQNPPTVYALVAEDKRAWHAGESQWQGRTWLNSSTIGIELVNPGYKDVQGKRQWYPYPEGQITALIALLKELQQRHQLPIDRVIGHSDIAPGRKLDPGPFFPWKHLADAGLIRWPNATQVARYQTQFAHALPDAAWFQAALAGIGYAVPRTNRWDTATRNALAAFQMKYRPERFEGTPDAQSAALLAVLQPPQK